MRLVVIALVFGCGGQSVPSAPVLSNVKHPDQLASIGMVTMKARCFQAGCSREGCRPPTLPERRVCLSTYAIDKYEVTVSKYAACMKAGTCAPSARNRSCTATWENADELPINCINWEDAQTYCKWVGKRLPTEAEWEYAARGAEGRKYPWGDAEPTCERVTGMGCGDKKLTRVGSKPAGDTPEGVADLAGSLAEFMADWWSQPEAWPADESEISNPAGPRRGRERVMKGGANGRVPGLFEGLYRQNMRGMSNDLDFLGFRCATSRVAGLTGQLADRQ